MIEFRSNRPVKTYTSYNNNCFEAKKECRKQIALSGTYRLYDCVERSTIPGPGAGPHPTPVPNYGRDARRHIEVNESVIMGSYLTVLGTDMNGLYMVRSDLNYRVQVGIRREFFTVTQVCNLGLCVNDQLISTSAPTYLTVVGLNFKCGSR